MHGVPIALKVELGKKRRMGITVAVRAVHRGMRELLLVCGTSGRPSTKPIAMAPTLLKVTLGVANFGLILFNKTGRDTLAWFPSVVLWPIPKPTHIVEYFAVFTKASGDDAIYYILLRFL